MSQITAEFVYCMLGYLASDCYRAVKRGDWLMASFTSALIAVGILSLIFDR